MKLVLILLAACALEGQPVRMPLDAARPILESAALPSALQPLNARTWSRWLAAQNQVLETRLAQGDADSLVHFLLFGTTFTTQPRIEFTTLAEATRAGTLRARVNDLLGALAEPGQNERLRLFANLLKARALDPANRDGKAGLFLYENLQRVLRENAAYAERTREASAFRDRGVSLDATLYPNFAIHQALAALSAQVLARGIRSAAIIGPGLDLIDKNSGHDFYPVQTLQPFALQEALASAGLGAPRLTMLDASPRVVEHIAGARSHAHTLTLARSPTESWLPEFEAYWRNFGSRLAETAESANPTARAIRVPATTVRNWTAYRLNIVTERLPNARFDLIAATNLFVYYPPLEQTLALANVSDMLAPGGLFLTNDELPARASIPLRKLFTLEVAYTRTLSDRVTVYQRD